MTLQSLFLIYATLFRLAMIAAGALSIALGYRLFRVGVFSDTGKTGNTSIEASVVGQKLSLKNAAPGTGFGLFGVIILVVMLVEGAPELTVKSLGKVPPPDNEGTTEVKVRGTGTQSGGKFEAYVNQGLEYDKNGDPTNAISSYENAFASIATPMNQLAWNYLQQGKAQDAIPVARLAAQFCPRQAAFADTLAEALSKAGQQEEAVMWITKAAALDPKYQSKMLEMKRVTKQ